MAKWFSYLAHVVKTRTAISFNQEEDQIKQGVWAVMDPVNPSNNLVEPWTDAQINQLAGWLATTRDEWARAIRYDEEGEYSKSLEALVNIFGNPFQHHCEVEKPERKTNLEVHKWGAMGKVYEDMLNMVFADKLSIENANAWLKDVIFIFGKKALKSVEFQFKVQQGKAEPTGLRYRVSDSTNQINDSYSGKIDYWALPYGSSASIVVTRDSNSPYIDEISKHLAHWSWGEAKSLIGQVVHLKNYQVEGYELKQEMIGTW